MKVNQLAPSQWIDMRAVGSARGPLNTTHFFEFPVILHAYAIVAGALNSNKNVATAMEGFQKPSRSSHPTL
jgi:hypothetical protein